VIDVGTQHNLIGAVLPKGSATSATIDLEQAGLIEHVVVPTPGDESAVDTHPRRPWQQRDFTRVDTGGPHEVLVVVDTTDSPDRAAEILIRHGGRLVTLPDDH
jgi:hypothetical protein